MAAPNVCKKPAHVPAFRFFHIISEIQFVSNKSKNVFQTAIDTLFRPFYMFYAAYSQKFQTIIIEILVHL